VARFIGSPEINLLPAELGLDQVLQLDKQRLPLRMAGGPGAVLIGWRPEIVRLAGEAANHAPGTVRLVTRLERIEVLGHEALLLCRHQSAEGTLLTARVDMAELDRQRAAGDWSNHVVLEVNVDQALLFDAQGLRADRLDERACDMSVRMPVRMVV
jgi:multiple sugar transport system ATP-binding protein